MTYYYYIGYDVAGDRFWGVVDEQINSSKTKAIFSIDSTEEILTYIKKNQMSHIDDVYGLERMLKKTGIILAEDRLVLCEEAMFT